MPSDDHNEDEETIPTEQSFRGVSIHYSAQNWIIPEYDYVNLLSEMSSPHPTSPNIQFTSKVGLARVALIAAGLGLVFGFHLLLLIIASSPVLCLWAVYSIAMCIYHFAEFLVTCRNHPGAANADSFLLNHSKHFTFALFASWTEFWLGATMFPQYKFSLPYLPVVGLILVTIGQFFRTTAMWQAGPSFTHLIAHEKQKRHKLVTHGLYRYLRHPSYFGWFYWSIGTQLVLCNPVCFIAYAYVAWTFFRYRLEEEEDSLVEIFGEEYVAYQKRSWIGIPGLT